MPGRMVGEGPGNWAVGQQPALVAEAGDSRHPTACAASIPCISWCWALQPQHTLSMTLPLPPPQVLIAVGGATYTNWARMNTASIAKFVQEFGLDGVDIDYEVRGPGVGRERCSVCRGRGCVRMWVWGWVWGGVWGGWGVGWGGRGAA